MLKSNRFMQKCVSGSRAIEGNIPEEYVIGIRVICIRARYIGIKGSASVLFFFFVIASGINCGWEISLSVSANRAINFLFDHKHCLQNVHTSVFEYIRLCLSSSTSEGRAKHHLISHSKSRVEECYRVLQRNF